MTPKDKAKELVSKYRELTKSIGVGPEGILTKTEQAKNMATICVEEILSLRMIENMGRGFDSEIGEGEFWRRVKTEIQKL